MTAFISVSGMYCPPWMPNLPFGFVIVIASLFYATKNVLDEKILIKDGK